MAQRMAGPPNIGHMADAPRPSAERTLGRTIRRLEGGSLRRNFYRRHYKPAVRRAGLPDGVRSTISGTRAPPSSSLRARIQRRFKTDSDTRLSG